MFKSILDSENQPHVLVKVDGGRRLFRTEMYADYKGGCPNPEFIEQMPYFIALGCMGNFYYRLNQYEADDIIGTGKNKEAAGYEVVVLSER